MVDCEKASVSEYKREPIYNSTPAGIVQLLWIQVSISIV